MLLFRQILHLTRNSVRTIAKRPSKMSSIISTKQVHQETMRHVNPFARINISSDIYVKLKSADVHEYPNADVFIAELHGGHAKNCTASMKVNVSDDEKNIDVVLTKIADQTDFHCELEVPVKANLDIKTKDGVSITNMFGDQVRIIADRDINTNSIRGTNISLYSTSGNIICSGMLLGQYTSVETKLQGNIFLDKLQGDLIKCRTDAGDIRTNCSYVERSEFVTNTGNLQLRNVHKRSEIRVEKSGNLNMNGVHGNISIYSKSGDVNLQLSELCDKNEITVEGAGECTINISHKIEDTVSICVNAASVNLDTTLAHLANFLDKNKTRFYFKGRADDDKNKLIVHSQGRNVKLGKLSWSDSLKKSMGITDPQ